MFFLSQPHFQPYLAFEDLILVSDWFNHYGNILNYVSRLFFVAAIVVNEYQCILYIINFILYTFYVRHF